MNVMDFFAFIQSYFVNPLWDRTGYNMVNTLVYAAVALGALFLNLLLKNALLLTLSVFKNISVAAIPIRSITPIASKANPMVRHWLCIPCYANVSPVALAR